MSNSLAFDPSSVADGSTKKPAAKSRLASMFHAFMESLVTANSRRSEAGDAAMYRYPPF